MDKKKLIEQIKQKKSYLCIGLDTDLNKIPSHLLKTEDPVFEFNKAVIEATKDFCVAYKLNIAFYESLGYKGWISLEKTIKEIPSNIFKIADAKRGDIGNTSKQYAKTFFETYDFDAITVSPYMGEDSISPFLNFEGKWVIILALTSNKGSADFQMQKLENGQFLYEQLLKTASSWGTTSNIMYVVGATHPDAFTHIRSLIPNHFLLIPGVGAQGGSLKEISQHALNKDIGILVNVSRGIIYPKYSENFPQNIAMAAKIYRDEMSGYIK
jgi:orotidine-5'-phosphate decarboxylase